MRGISHLLLANDAKLDITIGGNDSAIAVNIHITVFRIGIRHKYYDGICKN